MIALPTYKMIEDLEFSLWIELSELEHQACVGIMFGGNISEVNEFKELEKEYFQVRDWRKMFPKEFDPNDYEVSPEFFEHTPLFEHDDSVPF